jgi:hypothetical protein
MAIVKASKIYPNLDFGFEKIPSGNPGLRFLSDPNQSDCKTFFSSSSVCDHPVIYAAPKRAADNKKIL